jgi:hypothetical protein
METPNLVRSQRKFPVGRFVKQTFHNGDRQPWPVLAIVIAGLDPAIQFSHQQLTHWMPVSSTGMTWGTIKGRWHQDFSR